jgi:hypothetical protein
MPGTLGFTMRLSLCGVCVMALAVLLATACEKRNAAADGSPELQSGPEGAFTTLDFARYFPHKCWISDWSKDKSYPDGFRYKILATRDARDDTVELVVLLQVTDGAKEEMSRMVVSTARADGVVKAFCDGLAKEHGLDFEEQDFTEATTEVEFEERAARYGWASEDVE